MKIYLQYWLQRKKKCYNPQALCRHCHQPVSKHKKFCPGCISQMRYQAEDDRDYHDTLASIRADWHR